ncbi:MULTISPECIES: class F sortase [unclassified Streptomyces]|uniref:class F sortase n=1 Tax=unclassified Streptomyces TaxID=2593676 RepID=UPI0036E9B1C4
MARRRRRRPWYRTRAYRLARTVVVTVSLVVGGVWWAQGEESGRAVEAARPGPPAAPARDATDARGTAQRRPAAAPPTRAEPPRRRAAPRRPPTPTPPRAAPPPRTAPAPRATAPRAPAPRPRPLPRSRAIRLVIPFLSLDAPVMSLRLDRDRRLPAPPDDDKNLVGWYEGGPSPGQQGTAVAVGHLDTDSGPAVFAGLGELRRGRLIEVRRADGRTAVYAVDAIKTYEKDRFPNREVYGARGRPELRLITCGGTYHRRTGYSGNVVVFAHLVTTREPPARTAPRKPSARTAPRKPPAGTVNREPPARTAPRKPPAGTVTHGPPARAARR